MTVAQLLARANAEGRRRDEHCLICGKVTPSSSTLTVKLPTGQAIHYWCGVELLDQARGRAVLG